MPSSACGKCSNCPCGAGAPPAAAPPPVARSGCAADCGKGGGGGAGPSGQFACKFNPQMHAPPPQNRCTCREMREVQQQKIECRCGAQKPIAPGGPPPGAQYAVQPEQDQQPAYQSYDCKTGPPKKGKPQKCPHCKKNKKCCII